MILNSHFFVKDLSSQVFKWPRSFLPSVVFTYESLRSTKIMVLLFLEIMQPQYQIHVQVWYKPTVAKGFSINLAQEIITSCLGHNMAFTTIPSLIFSYLSLWCFCTPLNPETPIGDYDRSYPCNIHTISSRKVMRIKKYRLGY